MKAAWLVLVVACGGDVDPPWQLDHDRVAAVRATPPHIPSGATSQLDALVAHKGAMTEVVAPELITVVSPMALAGTAISGATITAPDDAHLAAARAELKLADGAPVPLELGVLAGGLPATKIVWLGDAADNPTLAGVTVDGAAPAAALVVPPVTDVRLFVDADDAVDIINWLSSCGTMHDYDLHSAFLRVEKADPQSGELALVVRDGQGGVTWQVWPISAE